MNRYSYKVKVLSLFNTHLFNLFVLHNYMYILMVWSFWGLWNNVNVMHIWARMTSCVSDKGPHTTLRYWGLNVKFELITGNQLHFSKIKIFKEYQHMPKLIFCFAIHKIMSSKFLFIHLILCSKLCGHKKNWSIFLNWEDDFRKICYSLFFFS